MNIEKGFIPEIQNETPEMDLANASVEEQQTLLGRMREAVRERAKPLIMALSLMTFSAGEMATLPNAEAQELKGGQPAVSEQEKASDAREAVNLWKRILNLPDNPAAVNPAQNKNFKRDTAKRLIYLFAARLKAKDMLRSGMPKEDVIKKLNETGTSGPDFDRAVIVLKDATPTLCAENNQTPTCTPEQLKQTNDSIAATAAGEVFNELLKSSESRKP